MDTPICDFVNNYIKENSLRLHMPGHKGKELLGFEKYDITEVRGADCLYTAEGIIKKSEENAARLFGSGATFYSCEGSSLTVRAMLYLVKAYAISRGDKSPYVLSGRNAHSSFVSGCALNDLEVKWLYPNESESYLSCLVTVEKLEKALGSVDKAPACVYITSPDYLGNMCDISALSGVCEKYGVPLVVDNAHGAYLKFLEKDLHPISLGAAMCADSAHKTLPALTGAGYLHISKGAPEFFKENARLALSLFGSTSPSYLILQSLDTVNKYIAEGYEKRLKDFAFALEKSAKKFPFIKQNEPLKLTLDTCKIGYRGGDFAKILEKKGIVCEFFDRDTLVLMLTPENGEDGIKRLFEILGEIEIKAPLAKEAHTIAPPRRIMSIREALFSPREQVKTENALGRALACANISCPPAVSPIVGGEEINQSVIDLCAYYGIDTLFVVK